MRNQKTVKSAQKDESEEIIFNKALPLLKMCQQAVRFKHRKGFINSFFLGNLFHEATLLEEFLDSIGAQKNEKWFPCREVVAAEKRFAKVYYNLMHVQKSVSHYHLLDVGANFKIDTIRILKIFKKAVHTNAATLLDLAHQCGHNLGPVQAVSRQESRNKDLPFLPANRKSRHVKRTGEIVTYLSSKFLNLTENREVKDVLKKRQFSDFSRCIPGTVNEEILRTVETHFHNLQSHYDTYIFESDIEVQNRNLSFLRGHISIIFHLLESATDISHFYERHMGESRRDTITQVNPPLQPEELLAVLFDYLLYYAKLYMESARNLCRSMIKSYATTETITVPIPNYRGFHVRPSTLIAKIIFHYGSTVTMILNNQEYNAGLPLDLFRANEEINAYKRRYIGNILSKNETLNEPVGDSGQTAVHKLHKVFLDLIKTNEIICYDNNLDYTDLEINIDETLAGLASRFIKYYMSTAKIDVQSDLTVTFKGDNRALTDIRLLAENGYGEDVFGNNIVLPEALQYLRQ